MSLFLRANLLTTRDDDDDDKDPRDGDHRKKYSSRCKK